MAERSEGMSGHTPGPWSVDGRGVVANGQLVRGRGRRRIAHTHATTAYRNAELDAENAANARLIAAAPDMLTELEEILEFATTEKSPLRTQEIASIRDVIARARGEVV